MFACIISSEGVVPGCAGQKFKCPPPSLSPPTLRPLTTHIRSIHYPPPPDTIDHSTELFLMRSWMYWLTEHHLSTCFVATQRVRQYFSST